MSLYCAVFSSTMPYNPTSLSRVLIGAQLIAALLYTAAAAAIKQEVLTATVMQGEQCIGKLRTAPGWDALQSIIQTTYQSARYITEKEFVSTQRIVICGLAKYLQFLETHQTANIVIAACTAAMFGIMAAATAYCAIRGTCSCCCSTQAVHQPAQMHRPHRPAPPLPMVGGRNPFLTPIIGRPLPAIPHVHQPVVAQPGMAPPHQQHNLVAAAAHFSAHQPADLAAMEHQVALDELAALELEHNYAAHGVDKDK